MATLKTILDAMLGEAGFLIPSGYASSANPDDVQLLHLANAASDELRELELTGARKFGSITLTAATDYTLPDDFHALIPDTLWSGQYPGSLPTTPAAWNMLRASGIGDLQVNARLFGRTLRILNPTPGQVLLYEYVSRYPWVSAASAPKERASADDDDFQLDTRALILATKWRFLKAKGLPDWQAELQLSTAYQRTLRGRDAGAQTISMGGDHTPDGTPRTTVVTC